MPFFLNPPAYREKIIKPITTQKSSVSSTLRTPPPKEINKHSTPLRKVLLEYLLDRYICQINIIL